MVYGLIAGGVSYLATLISVFLLPGSPVINQMSVIFFVAVLHYYSFRAPKGLFVLSVIIALMLILPRAMVTESLMKIQSVKSSGYDSYMALKNSYPDYFV